MEHHRVLILDFGGRYNQLIVRRVREHHVYCEVHPCTMSLTEIRAYDPIGIIFTGGPHSVYAPARRMRTWAFSLWTSRFSASATARSFWPVTWAGASSPPRRTLPESTERQRQRSIQPLP